MLQASPLCDKAPSAMGFEPMTPGYKPADNQSSCIRCCWCLYSSGILSTTTASFCWAYCRSTKSHPRQGTIEWWESNPRHEDFPSSAIPLSYCIRCCWCLCDHILPLKQEKIVEKKLRTQNFTSAFAFFFAFPAFHRAFLRNHPGKRPSKPGQRREHGSEAPFHPPARNTA